MPICTKIRRKKRQACIGGMSDRIILQGRDIKPPVFGDPDFDETFTNNDTVWATVNTISGKTFFDGVNSDINITHEILIAFDSTVTTEIWIELEDGRRVDILAVENLDERSEFMRLTCTDRGAKTIEATKT